MKKNRENEEQKNREEERERGREEERRKERIERRKIIGMKEELTDGKDDNGLNE